MWEENTEKVVRMMREKETLNRQGFKLTEQRQWILNLLKSEKKHLNAVEIYTALHQKKQSISMATVYRTLDLLVQLNLARKVSVANRPSVFEFDSDTSEDIEHYHLVCRECGRVIDVRPPELSKLLEMEEILTKQHHFKITNLHITYSGSCVRCKK